MPSDEAYAGERDCCACRYWYFKRDCACLAALNRHAFCERHRRDLLEGIDRLERETILMNERRRIVAAAGAN